MHPSSGSWADSLLLKAIGIWAPYARAEGMGNPDFAIAQPL